jgi:PAS domain S-box-containing protein
MTDSSVSRTHHRLSIGLLFDGNNLLQQEVIEGIETAAVAADIQVFAFDSAICGENAGTEAVKNAFSSLVNKRLIGGLIILAGAFPTQNPRERNQMYKRFHPLPLVTIGFTLPGIPSVLSDSAQGMHELVSHLAGAHRRKRIAFISGPASFPPTAERRARFESALRRRKLSVLKKLVIEGDFTYESGRRAVARLAAGNLLACDAIIAANDVMAAGAIDELTSRGIRVPETCAVAGFQNEEISTCTFPPLTTVAVSQGTTGRQAVELLAAAIRGARPSPVLVPTPLVVRESCGCAAPAPVDPTAQFPPPAKVRRRPAKSRSTAWIKSAQKEMRILFPAASAAAGKLLEAGSAGLLARLDAFGATGETGPLLAAWRAWLSLIAGLRGDLDAWMAYLPALCRHVTKSADLINALLPRAIADGRAVAQRALLYAKCLFPQAAMRLRDVEHKLLTGAGLDRIRQIITNDFPLIGITGCLFSLHAGSTSPLNYSTPEAGYDLEAPFRLPSWKNQFLTNRLFPAGTFTAKHRKTFFVEPLFSGTDFLGVCLLSAVRIDLALNRILRTGLQGALVNSFRLGEMNGEKAGLKTQLAGQTRELLRLTELWQREKRTAEKIQEELDRSETRYKRWFEEDFTGNFIAAANGDIINCNSAFARIFGFASVIEAQGANFGNFYPNKSALEDFYTLLGVVRRIAYYESEFVRKDGNVIHILGNIIGSFDDDNNLVEMQGFLFDNTDRKRLEEELRHAHKMDAIGRLAGGIAHDFNNILTGIMGYSELLLDKIPKSDPSQRDVEEIKKAAKSAASLTRQLLAFSRKQILKPLLLDLNDVVKSMRDLLIRIIGEHITLDTELDPDLTSVKADRGQIEQVIMNLVINSRDAMPQGGTIVVTTRNKVIESTIEFSSSVDIKPGPYVVLEVCDNGVGMDLETQSHIFEPFFSTKKIGQGVGLGLSTVYGIITQSGGFPEVMSEPHRGTTMRIYLPQYTSTAEVREERLQYQEEVKGTETILLVEDEDFVRDLAEKVLTREGYHVIAAHNAQEALSLVKKHTLSFDLVVTDIVMPGISGVELGQKIQALRPEIKVLYMSGYDDKMLAQHGESPVRINFIQKPFTPEILLRKVQDALNR